jgi:protein-L-isoaspartate(D-aspartate) O-methyltransferase
MPTPSEDDVQTHIARFVAMLGDEFRRYGVPEGLPPRLRDAVAATPRHGFVHRFRIGDGPLQDLDAAPDQLLPVIYSDQLMRHVDAAGELLPSSNSQPSYVLRLLHLLGLEQGQAVLEIGSGSGWLAAVMGRLVGPVGKVVGIELIPGLAAQSRVDLDRAGIGNVEIVTGDGALGHDAGAPYDRAIITAATWDLPAVLFEQVADEGRVLVPVELRDGSGCEVAVLRRQGAVLVAEYVVPGWFVPLLGPGQSRGAACRSLESLPFWSEVCGEPTVRHRLPLGGGPSSVATQFRAFLGRTESGSALFTARVEAEWRPWRPVVPPGRGTLRFGLVDEGDRSVALWDAGELIGYGGRAAAVRLARAYASWAAFGLPGMGAFGLEIHRADAAPDGGDHRWVEQRGATALAWSLKPDAASWRDLLGDSVAGAIA